MKFLTALLIFLSLGTLYAQGEYIEKGQNGYGITLGGGYQPKILSIGGTAAVSNSGIVDFGVGYSYLFGEKDTSEFKSTSTIITPFAGVHIMKQSDTNPVSLSARILFNIHRFTTKDETGQLSVGSWSIGATVFHRFEVSQTFQIQPFAALSYFRPERFPGYEAPSMIPVFDAALALITKKGETSKIILKPSVSFSTQETIYSLSFEFVDLL
ncbi:MAG: autotransporter outer membrane beta-barrel domain-containing protein [Acidobacteriota bacterium]